MSGGVIEPGQLNSVFVCAKSAGTRGQCNFPGTHVEFYRNFMTKMLADLLQVFLARPSG